MTWIKLEDEVADHPKIAGLSDRAFRWWIRSLCYCSRFLTDGAIPAVFLFGIKPNIRKELIDARLWIERDSRVEIHDYLKYQTSRNEVEKERERNRNRRNPAGRTAGTTAGTPNGRTEEKPPPESREQIQRTDVDTEHRESRARVQGDGAFEKGSLPRDHMRHALCGPSMRICLLSWQFDTLAKAYNAPENPHGTRAVIAQFLEQLESGLTPQHSIPKFSEVEKEFHSYLKSVGKVAPKIVPKVEPFSVAKALEREAARKAGAQ